VGSDEARVHDCHRAIDEQLAGDDLGIGKGRHPALLVLTHRLLPVQRDAARGARLDVVIDLGQEAVEVASVVGLDGAFGDLSQIGHGYRSSRVN
jgi:hypothetical protein